MNTPLLPRLLAASALATIGLAAAPFAAAGTCPAGQEAADGRGQPMSTEGPKAVTDVVVTRIELAREPAAIAGRDFRARKLEIQPGGIVPWHSHGDRPAILFIASGEVTEYASTCKTPIVHRAGEITPERSPTSHWWKNTGSVPVVIYSFDLFRVDNKKDEHMM